MMGNFDYKYLRLQLRTKLYELKYKPFQDFFSTLMQHIHSDFVRVDDAGGDGGNDGYIRSSGKYFQVYAPKSGKGPEAARKFVKDFYTLHKNWDAINKIQEYCFVYNDRFEGSPKSLEKMISDMKIEHPNLGFSLMLCHNIHVLFFDNLSDRLMTEFGFDQELMPSLKMVKRDIEKLEDLLNLEDIRLAEIKSQDIVDIFSFLSDQPEVRLDYDLQVVRLLILQENYDEAKDKLEILIEDYPNDVRPQVQLLYLERSFGFANLGYTRLLNDLKTKFPENWRVKLEILQNNSMNGDCSLLEEFEATELHDDHELYKIFYFLSFIYLAKGEYEKSLDFYNRSYVKNRYYLPNWILKMFILRLQLQDPSRNQHDRKDIASRLFEYLREFKTKTVERGLGSTRTKVIINSIDLIIDGWVQHLSTNGRLLSNTLNYVEKCYFNEQIDSILSDLLIIGPICQGDVIGLVSYLKPNIHLLSSKLCVGLILVLIHLNCLESIGLPLFEERDDENLLILCHAIIKDDVESFESCIKSVADEVISFAISPGVPKNIRSKAIELVGTQRPEIALRINIINLINSGQSKEALRLLPSLDDAESVLPEYRIYSRAAHEAEAWDAEIGIINKILPLISNQEEILAYKCSLWQAYGKLDDYINTIKLGQEILLHRELAKVLPMESQGLVLEKTIACCIDHSSVVKSDLHLAERLLKDHCDLPMTFDFKISYIPKLYCELGKFTEALTYLVSSIREKGSLTSEEYARLFLINLQCNQKLFCANTESAPEIVDDCFLKFSSSEEWFYIGEKEPLNCIPIRPSDQRYKILLGKKLQSTISIDRGYGTNVELGELETVYPIEMYLNVVSSKWFNLLSTQGGLAGIQSVSVEKNGEITPEYIERFLIENNHSILEEDFWQHKIPFSILAYSKGGVVQTLEFIRLAKSGHLIASNSELGNFQKELNGAFNIISSNNRFAIDLISVFLLIESGLIEKFTFLFERAIISQSQLNEIIRLIKLIEDRSQVHETLGLDDGHVRFQTVNHEILNTLKEKLIGFVGMIENKKDCVVQISSQTRGMYFPGLAKLGHYLDFPIIALKENCLMVTDDLLFINLFGSLIGLINDQSVSSYAFVLAAFYNGMIQLEDLLRYINLLISYRYSFIHPSSDLLLQIAYSQKSEELKFVDFDIVSVYDGEFKSENEEVIRVFYYFFLHLLYDKDFPIDKISAYMSYIYTNCPAINQNPNMTSIVLEIIRKDLSTKASENPETIWLLERFDNIKFIN